MYTSCEHALFLCFAALIKKNKLVRSVGLFTSIAKSCGRVGLARSQDNRGINLINLEFFFSMCL